MISSYRHTETGIGYKGIGYWRTENKGVESFLTDSLNDSMKI